MIKLSIVIISYNTEKITKTCLETTVASLSRDPTIATEIIVVDNASRDESVNMLHSIDKSPLFQRNPQVRLKVIESRENIGFGKGNNLGIQHARGEVLLLLNSDIEVFGDGIPNLYHFFTSRDNPFQFVGARLLNKDISNQPSCGSFYTLPVVFAALFLRGDYWGLTRYSPNQIKEVNWVSGACVMGKKDDFVSLGGFDKNIFMYMEEIDLFYRAKKRGMRIGYYPYARFIHLGSVSSAGRTQPIIQVYKGFVYFYKKHYSDYSLKLLKIMLQLKSAIAWCIGKATKNSYLITTYAHTFKLLKDM